MRPPVALVAVPALLACAAAHAGDTGWRASPGWRLCISEHGDMMRAVDERAPGARRALEAAAHDDARRQAMYRIDEAMRAACRAASTAQPVAGVHVIDADLLAYAASASDLGWLKNVSFTRFLSLDATADNGSALALTHEEVIALHEELDDILRRAQPPAYRRSLHRFRDALSAIEARMRTRRYDSPDRSSWMDAIAVVQETY